MKQYILRPIQKLASSLPKYCVCSCMKNTLRASFLALLALFELTCRLSLLYLCCLLFLQGGYSYGAEASFYGEKQRGWFWFEDFSQEDEEERTRDNVESSGSNGSAMQELQEFQKGLEESKAAMIMRPSVQNTLRYLKYQKEVFDRSDVVSQNWQEAMLVDPNMNTARNIPISDQAVRLREAAKIGADTELLREFSKQFKLLFFYKKSCIYCAEFANVLEVFAKRYDFKVAAVTLDGGIIEKFPASYNANLIQKFNIQSTPSLFAYSEKLGIAVPITHQFLAIDLLEKNAIFVAEKLRGKL